MAKAKPPATRRIRCYLCGNTQEVSQRTLSTTCSGCHRAIKVEDVVVKSYLPVHDVQTCGSIHVTKRGRIAARRVQAGEDVLCEGIIEGSVETTGAVVIKARANWKGALLHSGSLRIEAGAKLDGRITVPWARDA